MKFVVDVERGILAIGGEMHAEAEQRLLEHGSRQANLWGANYYPGRGSAGCIDALILHIQKTAKTFGQRCLYFERAGEAEFVYPPSDAAP